MSLISAYAMSRVSFFCQVDKSHIHKDPVVTVLITRSRRFWSTGYVLLKPRSHLASAYPTSRVSGPEWRKNRICELLWPRNFELSPTFYRSGIDAPGVLRSTRADVPRHDRVSPPKGLYELCLRLLERLAV
jgi:hypothetical protein